MKVFVLRPNESWIVDRFADEFEAAFPNNVTRDPSQADVIWLMADWAWNHLPVELLRKKPVLTSVHHLVPEKLTQAALADFTARDAITLAYHVPCETTARQVSAFSRFGKGITIAPFWVNGDMWHVTPEPRENIRRRLGLDPEAFLVGSFQRDTEGSDLISPKLEKGPDLLCDALEKMHTQRPNLHVVLAGWRRQYVIGRLKAAGIPHSYFELPKNDVVRDLYASLDLYLVTARYEGGPQAIVECAAMGVPIVSRPVGLAKAILAPESVGNDVVSLSPNVAHATAAVKPYMMPKGMDVFMTLLENVSRMRPHS